MVLACLLAWVPFASPQAPATVPPAVFHGRVVRSEDGGAVAGARAEVRWSRGKIHRSRSHGTPRSEFVEPPPFPSATTDAEGRFQIAYDPALDPWIVVEAESRTPGACGLLAGHGDAGRALAIALPLAARLEIDLDPGSEGGGAPAAGRPGSQGVEARVAAPLYASSFPPWLGVTGDETRLRFPAGTTGLAPLVLDGVPSGAPLEVEIARDGVVLGAISIVPALGAGETRRIASRLAGGWERGPGVLRAAVRDEAGQPVPGAELRIQRVRRAQSTLVDREHLATHLADERGSFRWPDLRTGTYFVDLGGDLCARPVAAAVDGTRETEVLLVARPSRTIRGRTVDAAGGPVANASVTFATGSAPEVLDVVGRSGADGVFELRGVPRDERGILRASHPSVPDLAVRQAETATAPDEGPRPDGAEEPLVLRFPVTRELSVRVVDAAGTPVAAQIRHGALAQLGVTWRGVVEPAAVLEVPPGPCAVSAATPDGRVAFSVAPADAREVVLELASAAALRLRHRGEPELLDVHLETRAGLRLGVTTLVSGVDEVVLVPPGEWVVRAAGRQDATVRAEPGAETLVER